jgi:hypothetical protein
MDLKTRTAATVVMEEIAETVETVLLRLEAMLAMAAEVELQRQFVYLSIQI